MTKKFIVLLCLGVPVVLVTGFASVSAAVTVFLVYNLVCLGLFYVDRHISPKETVLQITRDPQDKLYFKAENKIEINVRNTFHRPLEVELKDEIPDWHFALVSTDMLKVIPDGEEATFSYILRPSKRGSYLFERVHVRYKGILGLCKKYVILPLPIDFKVYPDLSNLSKYRLIIQNHRLLSQGKRRVNERGQGSEFESLREYVEGDDYRKVNWMATARENKLILNLFEAEKNQPIYILLDTGRSMSYYIRGYKKLDYAINAALILSDIVNQKGDNSGLMLFNTDVLALVPPGKGDLHRNTLMETLYHAEDTNNTSDYEGAFYELLYKQKRRSIVFLFTDFETEEEVKDLLTAIPIIARRHLPVIVLMENESLHKIAAGEGSTVPQLYHQGVAADLLASRERIMRLLNQQGILCMETEAENFALDVVNQYLLLRERFYR